MLLLFPVSEVDDKLAVEVAEWIAELGGVKGHVAALEWSPAVPEDRRERIRKAFREAFAHVREFEVKLSAEAEALVAEGKGWPVAPNETFAQAAQWVSNSGWQGPWYFFEPDNTPTQAGWLDKLEDEYFACGKNFMGVLENSWLQHEVVDDEGKIHTIRQQAGRHLVGTAIYPTFMAGYTQRHLYCPANVAFDCFLQQDLEYVSHHTNQIQHNWLTENYRREDGVIKCDAREGRKPGQKGFALARDVHSGAVVVHGCKDLSLLRLLRAERGNQVSQPVVVPTEPPVATETKPIAPTPEAPKPKATKPKKLTPETWDPDADFLPLWETTRPA